MHKEIYNSDKFVGLCIENCKYIKYSLVISDYIKYIMDIIDSSITREKDVNIDIP